MIVKEQYRCEYCKKLFEDKTACEEHERVCKTPFNEEGRALAKRLTDLLEEAEKLGIKVPIDKVNAISAGYDAEEKTIWFIPF